MRWDTGSIVSPGVNPADQQQQQSIQQLSGVMSQNNTPFGSGITMPGASASSNAIAGFANLAPQQQGAPAFGAQPLGQQTVQPQTWDNYHSAGQGMPQQPQMQPMQPMQQPMAPPPPAFAPPSADMAAAQARNSMNNNQGYFSNAYNGADGNDVYSPAAIAAGMAVRQPDGSYKSAGDIWNNVGFANMVAGNKGGGGGLFG